MFPHSTTHGDLVSVTNWSHLTATTPALTTTSDDTYDYINFENFDYSQMDYPEPTLDVPLWEVIVKISFYVFIVIVSLIGNALIIVIVMQNKRMRTTTNYYIVNLAISDELVTVCCSWVHIVNNLTEGWILGDFFCKVNSFAQVLALVASILTLTLIAGDRFFGIVFAMKAHVMEMKAWYGIAVVWVISLAVAIPLLFVRQLHSRTWANHQELWCDDEWPVMYTYSNEFNATVEVTSKQTYYTVVSVVLYLLPVVVMTIAYGVIINKLWLSKAPGEQIGNTDSNQEKVKRRVIMMLIVILILFTLSWLPFHMCILYDMYRPNKQMPLGDWYQSLHYAALYLGYSNSAVNPVIYAGFNEKFRKGFRVLLRCYEKDTRYNTIMTRQDSFHSTTMVTKV